MMEYEGEEEKKTVVATQHVMFNDAKPPPSLEPLDEESLGELMEQMTLQARTKRVQEELRAQAEDEAVELIMGKIKEMTELEAKTSVYTSAHADVGFFNGILKGVGPKLHADMDPKTAATGFIKCSDCSKFKATMTRGDGDDLSKWYCTECLGAHISEPRAIDDKFKEIDAFKASLSKAGIRLGDQLVGLSQAERLARGSDEFMKLGLGTVDEFAKSIDSPDFIGNTQRKLAAALPSHVSFQSIPESPIGSDASRESDGDSAATPDQDIGVESRDSIGSCTETS